MDILLDTHIALWLLNDDSRLTKETVQLIMNPKNTVYYSVVSMWEIAIKHSLHPNEMNKGGLEFMLACELAGYKKLPLDDRHVCALETLEGNDGSENHKDPFDKILLSQAKADCMTLLTHDHKFKCWNEPYYLVV